MGTQWWFRERQPNEKLRDPIQGEFFTEDSISDPARALVRESVQNVLDAQRGSDPLRVRFRLGELPADESSRYLLALRPHVEEVVPSSVSAFASDRCRFLVIEDFGTTGLTGDIEATAPEPGVRNNYYSFVWAEGASSKVLGERGRWGLGKYVFPKNSRIFSFFAVTVQHPDGGKPLLRDGEGRMLIGMSVLKNHRVGTTDHVPDGYWARDPETRAAPFIDTATIDDFCSTWSVGRGSSEGGLSLVLPHLDQQVDRAAIIDAILAEYFIAIDRGQISFEVVDAAGTVIIDAESLRTILDQVGGEIREHVSRSLDLLRWWSEAGEASTIRLPQRPVDVDELLDEAMRTRAADLLAEERGRVAVEAAVSIRLDRKGESARWARFIVLFESDPGASSDIIYSRGGLIIPDVRGTAHHGVRSILLADDPVITQFLGDAEDPGHTQWKESGEHFKGRYELGPTRLRFVRHFPGAFIRAVRRDREEVVADYLEHWLSVAGPKAPRPTPAPGGGGGTGTGGDADPPDPTPRRWSMTRDEDGTVHMTVSERLTGPSSARVSFAYDILRGNAFSAYEPFDFVLDGHGDGTGPTVRWESSSGTIEVEAPNVLMVRDIEPGSVIALTGFDVNRDVKIDTRPIKDPR